MSNGLLGVITPIQSATLLATQARALKRKRTTAKDIIKDFSTIVVGAPLIKSTANIIKSV